MFFGSFQMERKNKRLTVLHLFSYFNMDMIVAFNGSHDQIQQISFQEINGEGKNSSSQLFFLLALYAPSLAL